MESLSLKKSVSLMFSRLMNRCVFSSLSVVAVSFGLFSCGGGSDSGDGDSLPDATMLDLSASLTSPTAASPWPLILKLVGNGSDLPGVSINAASSNESSPLNVASVVYRRTGRTAILRGNFTVASGQWTEPGPVIVTNRDKIFVNANISFASDRADENCGGSFTGSISYEIPGDDDEESIIYSATEGMVSYTVTRS